MQFNIQIKINFKILGKSIRDCVIKFTGESIVLSIEHGEIDSVINIGKSTTVNICGRGIVTISNKKLLDTSPPNFLT